MSGTELHEFATKADLLHVEQRLDRGDSRFDQLEAEIRAGNALAGETRKDIAEMLDYYRSIKGAFRVFDMIGKLAKPMAAIVALGAAVVGLWTAIKTGLPR